MSTHSLVPMFSPTLSASSCGLIRLSSVRKSWFGATPVARAARVMAHVRDARNTAERAATAWGSAMSGDG
jgi:hypothetical protein